MSEALEAALAALGHARDDALPTPIPLSRIRAQLAPEAELGDDVLTLLAILREDDTAMPSGAMDLVAHAIEHIDTAIERLSLA